MRVQIKASTPQDVCNTILSMGELSGEQLRLLCQCAGQTTQVWVGTIDDKFIAAWGLVPMTILSDFAYLWLWTPPKLEHQFLFVRHSKRMIEQMLDIYPTIYGVTTRDNTKAQRWLSWLGMKYAFDRDDGLLVYAVHRSPAWQTLSA